MSAVVESSSHQVHFYDAEDELLSRLVRYVGTALRLGHDAIIVCRPQLAGKLHMELHREHLGQAPFGRERGELMVLDAQAALDGFMVQGWPDPKAFAEQIGRLFESATEDGRTVVAYGEMVALLCEQGEFAAALRLEEIWNDLLARKRFTLLCAYPSKLFSNMQGKAQFAHICAAHNHVTHA